MLGRDVQYDQPAGTAVGLLRLEAGATNQKRFSLLLLNKMSTLITGSTGFIGSRLAKVLAERGETVHALCRATANVDDLRHSNIRIFTGDVMDAESVSRAMQGCSHVYHLAAFTKNWARDPEQFIQINCGGLQHVLTAARHHGVEKVVFTSTSLTVPPSNGKPSDETSMFTGRPLTEYARSKIAAENLAREAAAEGMHVVIVNPTRVFGPGILNEANSATLMIKQYLDGTWRVIPGDGNGVGNYVFVDDVVRGHIAAMEHGRSGEKYVLGGENANYHQLFGMISELSHRKRWMITLPKSFAMAFANFEQLRAEVTGKYPMISPEWAKIFLSSWACSTAKAERELGYIVTPLRSALATTIGWLRQQVLQPEVAR